MSEARRAVPAPFLRRLASAFYDALLIGALCMTATLIGSMAITLAGVHYSPGAFRGLLFLVALGYCGACWVHGGQTLGMRVWRLHLSTDRGPTLNWPRACMRYALGVLAWFTVVGVLWAALDRRKRALHDILTGAEMTYTPL